MSLPTMDFVGESLARGAAVLAQRAKASRKALGQFLTPAPVARFMARQLGPLRDGARIVDPAAGSGTLLCALVERALAAGTPSSLHIEAFEVDEALCAATRALLAEVQEIARARGLDLCVEVHARDFLLAHLSPRQPTLWEDPAGLPAYDYVIANPPYFKLPRDDARVRAALGQLDGHTNIYTLFMAVASQRLREGGRACFLVPRSFCSGAYFAAFRRQFLGQAAPIRVHQFESRQETFKEDAVLQENVILTFERARPRQSQAGATVRLTTSQGSVALGDGLRGIDVALSRLVGQPQRDFWRLPTSELDDQLVRAMERWDGSLERYGLRVSTGPVVPFRAGSLLTDAGAVARGEAVPLLWLHNVFPQRVEWPARNGNKPQGVLLTARGLLVAAACYVLVRRFSAKEEPRRLVAAALDATRLHPDWIGLENHLNFLWRKGGTLSQEEAAGLATLLNSALLDRYFRILSGHTQVNAAELRALPLPPLEQIRQIGRAALAANVPPEQTDELVHAVLRRAALLPATLPILRETRLRMAKIQEAQTVLQTLGLPPAQQNEMAALTLLALAHLSEATPWREAQRPSLRIHDMLGAIKARFGRQYAENTRETIRRQVIHQFEQAGLVARNPDNPALATNSPRTHYALSPLALRALRAYGTDEWLLSVQSFADEHGSLRETYQQDRTLHRVPLRLADGSEVYLSPGEHNQLQATIVEQFGPRFASGARLLYLGDTAQKSFVLDAEGFRALNLPTPSHDKLPDLVLWDTARQWLFLIEAVTSHGPVSPKRRLELERVFASCPASRVYVTAFPDFATYKAFAAEIAWETEVWIAEAPSHMIHFNGERFLGPSPTPPASNEP